LRARSVKRSNIFIYLKNWQLPITIHQLPFTIYQLYHTITRLSNNQNAPNLVLTAASIYLYICLKPNLCSFAGLLFSFQSYGKASALTSSSGFIDKNSGGLSLKTPFRHQKDLHLFQNCKPVVSLPALSFVEVSNQPKGRTYFIRFRRIY
jgi:hypothetical protein